MASVGCAASAARSFLENSRSTHKTVVTSEASIAWDCGQSSESGGSFGILVGEC